ncbi:MAG: ATP-binding protein [Ruminococcus flavefaciens]|nr:ATP-binding protein [Ruminococcus flavefaciens]MCM1229526.1 ATP-binding protein [Ruminococcus flavefaciens]
MFRKVQLKFFGIITAILIAIFIALLSGINIIMDVLMERQVNVVLEQVASGVEYNSSTDSFTFTNPHKNDEPPKKELPTEESTTTAVTTSVTSSSHTSTVKSTTAETVTESDTEEVTDETNPPTIAPDTEPPYSEEETDPPTDPPAQQDTEPVPPTYEPQPDTDNPEDDPNQGERGEYPNEQFPDPWHDDWWNHRDWDNHDYDSNQNQDWNDGRAHPDREVWGGGGFMPTACISFVPLFNTYKVTDSEKQPAPPEDSFSKSKLSEPVPKSLNSINFFVIMADNDGAYVASLNNDDMTEETAQNYITQILNSKDKSGMADNYSFCTEKKVNGTVMVLTDRTSEMNIMHKLKRTTFIVGFISIVVLSIGAYFISGLIVRPLKYTFEKQKQFISDASHELKTPLTVISANADVLSGEIGDNKWLNYIQDQADRMNVLVNDLLSLTRLENKTGNFIQTEFNLSQAITNTALPFECQAFESNKNFVLNIEENITVFGSEQHIKQMAGIFIDNALKYSKDGGTVRVSLTREDGKTVFSVYNTGNGVKEEDKYRIFERFYRSDESRNRSTGGYGLGLAIAKSIIDKHKFKIEVENEEGRSICFIVKM